MNNNFFSRLYLFLAIGSAVACASFFFYRQTPEIHESAPNNETEVLVEKKETITAAPALAPEQQTQDVSNKEESTIPNKPDALALPVASSSDMPAHSNQKDYCKGFTSLNAEFKLKNLTAEGIVPPWLYGSFVLIGPAKFEIDNHCAKHWLEGFSMIHRFSFKNGHVSYKNRFLETNYSCTSLAKRKFSDAASGGDPNASYFSRLAAAMSPSKDKPPYDNTNVNVVHHGNCCMALTETPHVIAYDLRSLNTKGRYAYNDDLEPHVSSAHPLIDTETGELYNIATTFAKKSSYTVYKMSPNSMKRIPVATIATSYPSYMHSFAMSKRYLIITEIPFVVSPYDLVMSGKPYIENFQWKPKQKTKITVISKASGEVVRSYEVAPFFTFHHINAYDTGEKLFVDLISLPDSSHMKSFYLHQIRDHKNIEFPQGNITRLTLDLTSSNAQSGTLSALQIEMPRINADYAGKPYRYIYGLNSSDEYNYYDRIIKIDLTTDTLTGWHQDHCYVSEAVFVPRPNGHAEDDGVLLATILDTKSGTSSLIILSGSNMQLLARIKLPHHIPFTTHSNYFPKQNVK